jgi:hypothetical protein
MRDHRRRIPLILGSALLAMMLIFPVTASAARHRVIPADVLGSHTWNGTLCDGRTVSVVYHVTERGRLVFDSVSGAQGQAGGRGHFLHVRFPGAATRLGVWVHWRHGTLHLHQHVWQRACETPPTPPAVEPPPIEEPPTPQLG